jgi:lipopolysaccharide/colanic/teichoic acid biosynthesis glycosyltransferase
MIGGYTIIAPKHEAINELHWRIVKRVFDVVFTLLLFITVLCWLWPLLTILQFILNPGPVLYKSKLYGRKGECFDCYKFRLMKPAVNEGTTGLTGFAKFMQRFCLNQIPQFVNVIMGDMSIVGPRPYNSYDNKGPNYRLESYLYSYLVKPGLTGWAQVNTFRTDKNSYVIRKQDNYDLWYLENWTFLLDLKIIYLTVRKIIKG